MSGCVNKVMLAGYIGKDPEVSTTRDGQGKIARFDLAVNKSWRDKATGERKQVTTWLRVVSFNNNLSGIIEQYVRKGSHVWVEGELGVRRYTDKNGIERWVTEVILPAYGGAVALLDRKEGNRAPDSDDYSQYGQASSPAPDRPPPGAGVNEDVPF